MDMQCIGLCHREPNDESLIPRAHSHSLTSRIEHWGVWVSLEENSQLSEQVSIEE